MKIIMHKSVLLDIDEAAEYLGLKKSALYQMTFKRTIPFVKIGKRVRFTKMQLDDFINKKTVEVGQFED